MDRSRHTRPAPRTGSRSVSTADRPLPAAISSRVSSIYQGRVSLPARWKGEGRRLQGHRVPPRIRLIRSRTLQTFLARSAVPANNVTSSRQAARQAASSRIQNQTCQQADQKEPVPVSRTRPDRKSPLRPVSSRIPAIPRPVISRQRLKSRKMHTSLDRIKAKMLPPVPR